MSRHWIGVASAEHVERGREGGFMQVCHGKAAPLRRLQPGDSIVYYSPTRTFRGAEKLQAFTAFGILRPGEPYQVDRGGGFRPFRRAVDWRRADEVPIRRLVGQLEFTSGRNWGARLRYGLVEIDARDLERIAAAMLTATGDLVRVA